MLLNTFKVATKALLVNKGRTFLTTLGIIIGVFSVVMLTGLGNGLQAYDSEQFESLGSNTVFVSMGQMLDREGGVGQGTMDRFLSEKKFTLRDIERVKRLREYVKDVAYNSSGIDEAKFLNNTMRVTILGTLANYPEVITVKIASGRYFNESEEKGARKFFSIGAGFKYNVVKLDVSYLFSASKVRNPLENTLRFSLTFNFGDKYDEY